MILKYFDFDNLCNSIQEKKLFPYLRFANRRLIKSWFKSLSPVYTSTFYVTIFMWQVLFARVDEQN